MTNTAESSSFWIGSTDRFSRTARNTNWCCLWRTNSKRQVYASVLHNWPMHEMRAPTGWAHQAKLLFLLACPTGSYVDCPVNSLLSDEENAQLLNRSLLLE